MFNLMTPSLHLIKNLYFETYHITITPRSLTNIKKQFINPLNIHFNIKKCGKNLLTTLRISSFLNFWELLVGNTNFKIKFFLKKKKKTKKPICSARWHANFKNYSCKDIFQFFFYCKYLNKTRVFYNKTTQHYLNFLIWQFIFINIKFNFSVFKMSHTITFNLINFFYNKSNEILSI